MFAVVAVGAAAVGYGVKVIVGPRNMRYSQWSGVLVDAHGNPDYLKLEYIKITDDGEMVSKGTHNACKYKLEGKIQPTGHVSIRMKVYKPTGKEEIELDGLIVAPNKIGGNWRIKGKGFGTFTLEMDHVERYNLAREIPLNAPAHDCYAFSISKNKHKICGLGADSVGPYLILGHIDGNHKTCFTIKYFNKFTIEIKGKFDENCARLTEATWSISKGGKGKCIMERLQLMHPIMQAPGVPQMPPAHYGFGMQVQHPHPEQLRLSAPESSQGYQQPPAQMEYAKGAPPLEELNIQVGAPTNSHYPQNPFA